MFNIKDCTEDLEVLRKGLETTTTNEGLNIILERIEVVKKRTGYITDLTQEECNKFNNLHTEIKEAIKFRILANEI